MVNSSRTPVIETQDLECIPEIQLLLHTMQARRSHVLSSTTSFHIQFQRVTSNATSEYYIFPDKHKVASYQAFYT